MAQQPEPQDPTILIITPSAHQFLDVLQSRFGHTLTKAEIIAAALNVYELHTRKPKENQTHV